jgi:hypothetical protein
LPISIPSATFFVASCCPSTALATATATIKTIARQHILVAVASVADYYIKDCE